ncbi:MAG: tail fiber domain-containing protein [Clostridiales bacterium]|nr:tail fiber domain-containing protein [Clostridiales bacterium]
MYTLWIRNTNDSTSEELCIYNDESTFEEYKVEEASLSLEEGSAGSLSLKVPLVNVGYSEFQLFATEIIIRKKGAVYWIGRLLNSSEDFNGSLSLTFEGSYNYMMDTILTQYHSECLPTEWLRYLVDKHNEQRVAVDEYWKIVQIGYVDPNIDTGGNTDFYSNYETALDLVNNVMEGWSMHPVLTYNLCSSVTYKDYSTSPATSVIVNYDKPYWNVTINVYKEYYTNGDRTPTIKFGENLEDYTQENNVEELATVVIPKGAAYDDTEKAEVVASFTTPPQLEQDLPIDGLDYYRTIYRANNGVITLVTEDADMLRRFGVVCKVVEFNDCKNCTELKALGQKYLRDQKWIGTTISINAIDASLLGAPVDEIKIGVGVICYSEPHGLNHIYPCTGIQEDLLDPSATTFTLGIKDDGYLSDSSRKADEELKQLIINERLRESLIRSNVDNDIRESFNDSTIYSGSQMYQALTQSISDGMAYAQEHATDDAKQNALTLLNIFDSEDNPTNKGYVFFRKENRPYSGSKISIDGLKTRIRRYFNVSDDFFNRLKSYMDPTYSNGYMITVILGSNDYETAILVHGDRPTDFGNSNPYIQASGNRQYSWNSSNTYGIKYVNGYSFFSNATTRYQTGGGSGIDWTGSSGSATPLFSSVANTTRPQNFVYPNKATLDRSGEDYTVYVSYNIKDTNGNVYFEKNLYLTDSEFPVTYDDHIYEICISDKFDYMDSSANLWRWNKSGLYYITGGWTDENRQSGYGDESDRLKIAITADGQIVADRITAGRLDAGIVRAGYLCSQDFDPNYDPQDTASFVLDIEHGKLTSKIGTLIFNCTSELDGSIGNNKAGQNNFVYLSNLTTGQQKGDGTGYMEISGQKSNEWLFILGSNFGVDMYGRVFMREGIIGATGGIWNLSFFNDAAVNLQWVDSGTTGVVKLQYKVTFNTTSYRPMGAQVNPSDYYNSSKELLVCRWRLAKYDANNQFEYYTSLFNFSPTPGNGTYEYDWTDFPTPITYTGTAEEAMAYYADTYYKGVFFPVYYRMDDTSQDPDYTQDNHYFELVYFNNVYGAKVVIESTLNGKPQYTAYSNPRYTQVGTDMGAVKIGSGYLYNGSIGANSSFSLSAIDRSATVANYNKSNWRLTVGSRFGVTSDGTLYCYGAILTNVTASGTVAANTVATNNVGGVIVNGTHAISGTIYTYNLNLTINYSYSVDTISIYLKKGTKTDGEGDHPINPEPDSSASSHIPQDNFYGDIQLKLTVKSFFQLAAHPDVTEIPRSYEFTYLKNTTTGWTGTVSPQVFNLGTDDWKAPPSGGDWIFTRCEFTLEMLNERTGEGIRPTWTMASSGINAAGYDATSTTGSFTVQKIDSDNTRPCFNIGNRDLITNGYLGGPLSEDYVSHAYINKIHYNDLDQGSSRLYKTDIVSLTDIYDRLFDELRPVSYMYKNDERKVHHTGFIMEEVGDILRKIGLSPSKFGAYNPNENGLGGSINYIDFIAINTKQIQALKQRVKELEERLYEVEHENSSNTEGN